MQSRIVTNTVPMKRRGTPAGIAPTFVYLVSDESAYVTAQAISLGGVLLAGMLQTATLLADCKRRSDLLPALPSGATHGEEKEGLAFFPVCLSLVQPATRRRNSDIAALNSAT
jgi:hypothetical protein